MRLADLNNLPADAAVRELLRCCGSTRWGRAMAAARPFPDISAIDAAADRIFDTLEPADWLEAFGAHPRIGESGGGVWSSQEQAGARGSDRQVRERLAKAQRDYEARFGYIFIICATGKSAGEMLSALERRVMHGPDEELRAAADEQRKITHLRMRKLLE
jgi:2-oxo-4-hydroxy-4-carboxy-5-ureidoimidazoline decarboxylase